MSPLYVIGITLASVVGFVGMWSAIVALIGAVSGWRTLAHTYASERRPSEEWRTSGRLKAIQGYSGVLYVGGSAAGLHLRTMFVYRPGHAPLVIPWDAIQVTGPAFSLWGEWVELQLPGIRLALPKAAWEAASSLRGSGD